MSECLTIKRKPWGYEQHLPDMIKIDGRVNGYRTKILVVYPKQSLSLQYHMFRNEKWEVLSGRGTIIIGSEVYPAYQGTEWMIPRTIRHRLMASPKEEIVVKEYSTGDVWNEDDIIRLEDQYKRLKT